MAVQGRPGDWLPKYLQFVNVRRRQRIEFLIKALLSFANPKKWGVISETFERTSFDHAFTVSYSQAAEDIALLQVLGSKSGFYIDVGAHHPSRFSVTRLLYQRGWNGINIDANPAVQHIFEQERPRDIFIHAAVGPEVEYQFTIFEESALSTTNIHWRERFQSQGNKVDYETTVRGIKLYDLIMKLPQDQRIDLLNIDIEGADLEALLTLELEMLPALKIPKYLILETSGPVRAALELSSVKKAVSWGYIPFFVLPMTTILQFPQ